MRVDARTCAHNEHALHHRHAHIKMINFTSDINWMEWNGMRAPFIWNYVLQQSSSDIHSRRARALTISTKYRLWFCHSSPFGLCLFVGFFFISFWSRLFFMAAWVKWIMVIPPYSIRMTLLIRNKSRLLLHWFDFLSFVLQPRFLSVPILQLCVFLQFWSLISRKIAHPNWVCITNYMSF